MTADKPDRSTRATQVYERLRREILHGDFAPGAKLGIESIASGYGVGNNAVREALSRLSAERLVDRHERRGYFAPTMGLDDWRSLGKTRCWVESLALRESIANRTDTWEEHIVVAYRRLARLSFSGDNPQELAKWNEAHRKFHRAIIANCGSPWLIDFCDHLADQASRYVHISNLYRGFSRDGRAEHAALMNAVLDGTAEQAVKALVDHYSTTLRAIEDLLSRNATPEPATPATAAGA
jgi:DNA-binding GntR family transcriptional regulator